MPIYEYQCRACDAEFEHFVRSVESPEPAICPTCRSKKVQRRLSVFAARQGAGASSMPAMPAGGCGRCGDPDGPCALGGEM